MYSAQQQNGAEGATINPATINPAALNTEVGNPSGRGLKRSRSPEAYQDVQTSGAPGDDGSDKPRKRGRPMKPRSSGGPPDHSDPAAMMNLPLAHQQPQQAQAGQLPQMMAPQTPQTQNAPLPAQTTSYTPAQASPPPKTTPTKTTLKALPTVRDHTTDQLGPGGDEYIPREIDEAGEKKVMQNGTLLGNRVYRCRTFLVPNRGDKLFMLATECARVLGYRDSYLLFNKNRSLFKIIASQVEKDDLVAKEILPFSYRSRQIAIVTARSMFRQFGSRVVENGRRVRDDYWEGKARKQGFTEQDMAGEKRPGASRAREAAAAAEAAHNAPALLGGPHTEIVYASTPGQFGAPQAPLMQPDDNRSRDYSTFIKGGPRQEITGPPYADRTQPSSLADMQVQSQTAHDYNRQVNQQRQMRGTYMDDYWRKPHEQPVTSAAPASATDTALPTTRPGHQSPQVIPATSGMISYQSPQMVATAPPYGQPIHPQQAMGQGPLRGMPSGQKQSRPSSMSSSGPLPQGGPSYNYGGQNPMWNHSQAPQTPQHYQGYTTQAPQQSPHPQQQSPVPQMRHPAGTPQMAPNMQYPGMQGLAQGYPGGGQGMYPPDQTPRQFMPQNPPGAPAVGQGWSNQQTSSTGSWWANQPQ